LLLMTDKRGRYSEGVKNDERLLQGARAAVARKGAAVSIADIAAASGLGVGSIYRRFAGKEELLQHLCALAMDQVSGALEAALAKPVDWRSFSEFIEAAVACEPGALAAVAEFVEATEQMWASAARVQTLLDRLVRRAQEQGDLRPDVTPLDIQALIVHLGRHTSALSPAAEANIQRRLVAVALAGLRAESGSVSLPGYAPEHAEYDQAWVRVDRRKD
jgi:AcrR family transcriptional regulator